MHQELRGGNSTTWTLRLITSPTDSSIHAGQKFSLDTSSLAPPTHSVCASIKIPTPDVFLLHSSRRRFFSRMLTSPPMMMMTFTWPSSKKTKSAFVAWSRRCFRLRSRKWLPSPKSPASTFEDLEESRKLSSFCIVHSLGTYSVRVPSNLYTSQPITLNTYPMCTRGGLLTLT